MKQIKFKQLATFGLCCSLLGNSLTGVTAVAETVTIESSPTAESTKESPKERTETSETTTETSREEATQETEKQEKVKEEETEAAQVEVEQEETETSEVIQPNPVPLPASGIGVRAGNVASVREQVELMRIPARGQATITVPDIRLGIVLNSLDKVTLNTADFDIVAKGRTMTTRGLAGGTFQYYLGTVIDFETSKTNNSLDILIPSRTLTAKSTAPYTYDGSSYYMNPINLTVPKYIKAISIKDNQTYDTFAVSHPGFGDGRYRDSINPTITKKSEVNYELSSDASVTVSGDTMSRIFRSGVSNSSVEGQNQFHVTLPKQDIVVNVDNRKVTENFKDVNGTAIPAPTGFTQGKQTSITNNDYTFTQGGTLPDSYTVDGKTYKFKGWYKGKTKPATLETSKTPSYKVTYDDNDDLNVVYEEAMEFPEETFQFGFVNQDGQLVKSDDITIAYDYSRYLVNNGTTTWNGIDLNQKAITDGKLKKITMPKSILPMKENNGEAMINISFSLPKYYIGLNIYNKSGKIDSNYPLPPRHYYRDNQEMIGLVTDTNFINWLTLAKAADNSYVFKDALTSPELINSSFPMMRRGTGGYTHYFSLDAPVYYHLTQRKVTENFVDASGAKITPPTDFTQGKQTVIDSDPYTFKQSGTLPETYKANGKTYKLKGWYKGKTKPSTLETSKTPSYKVTYDDNDDLNVVYEDLGETTTLPAQTFKFNFVDEQGNLVNPSGISLKGNLQEYVSGETPKIVGEIIGKDNGMVKEYTIPEKVFYGVTDTRYSFYGAKSTVFTIPKYYKALTKDPGIYYSKTAKVYPVASIRRKNFITGALETETSSDLTYRDLFRLTEPNQFLLAETQYNVSPIKRTFTALGMTYRSPVAGFVVISEDDRPIYYYLENRRVTENFVDATGAKITPPADFTQSKQTVIDSDNFTYTSAKALPASYTADGKSYVLQGWYKGTEKPTTLETSKTPSYSVTYNDQDDLTVVYKEGTISADLTMRGAVDVIDNGAPMEYWEVLLKNTGEVPLTSIKIKPTTDWMSGISAPTELFILGTGQNTKARPITKEQWEAGFEIPLDSSLPVGGQLTINLIGTKVTGQPGQVLKAAVEVTGNFGNLKASDTVRIKDLDQEIKEPTGEGFISVPTFDFGQVGVASATKQHGLKKAADYYGNGTRNPYVRISKTQPNWSLTAQLSQPKSATDSLPTATRLLLGAAPVSSFSNYNQPTELKNAIGTTNAIHLTANNAATSIIANKQFTGSDVYQLDFTFDNIKLEVPANQGTAGQQYQAAVTWNLVTGP
ncbi:WxL domain-containing protein [Enterococcus faecalis]|uniref:WxL domain-containing protein n=1 Tax=Enterococcus faecalis TaxID=1351 RepID=UPI000FF8AFE1|nr:WxL domain-containing protein [Enterococcus faecalis]RXA16430.1 WxL domain-containing protein [Enterococcus faecalis]RXA90874.1 WxL domain-containing protein [Enterococcus faecalis]RXA91905.1 WxL domain-containing protein [Enterococcus faecalis]